MSIKLELENGEIAVIRISGKLKLEEFLDAQRYCEEIIKNIGHVKILAITSEFEGWEKAEGWGDWSFAEKNDPYIKKIAIVGDENWKDLAFAFSGKGLRPVEIEYFDLGKEDTARLWLSSN